MELLDHIRAGIEGLCPIIGTVNMKRRAVDSGDNGIIKSILLRTAASMVVAIVIGLASGFFSSFIMVQVMKEQFILLEKRVDRIENNYLDRRYYPPNRGLD